jgi:polyribonucleotide nucleotidyltransferase
MAVDGWHFHRLGPACSNCSFLNINGITIAMPSIPQVSEMSSSELDLVIAGTRDAVLMIEGYCSFLSEDQMMQVCVRGLGSHMLL